jgi:hypothetical protein
MARKKKEAASEPKTKTKSKPAAGMGKCEFCGKKADGVNRDGKPICIDCGPENGGCRVQPEAVETPE